MTRAGIEMVPNGRVVPMTFVEPPRPDRPGRFDGSVHYSDGEVCELAAVQMAECRHEPALPTSLDGNTLKQVPGHHVFGGLVNNVHFGHFITESLVRLWAFDHLSPAFRSVVFYKYNNLGQLPDFVIETLGLLIPGVEIVAVDSPANFEVRGCLQELEWGSYIYGHPFVRRICSRLRVQAAKPEGPKKVYVSRSRLSVGQGLIIGEQMIDDYMRAEGYAVLYPEAVSIREQLEAYSNADQLVFADGSAVHLYALVAQPTQKDFRHLATR